MMMADFPTTCNTDSMCKNIFKEANRFLSLNSKQRNAGKSQLNESIPFSGGGRLSAFSKSELRFPILFVCKRVGSTLLFIISNISIKSWLFLKNPSFFHEYRTVTKDSTNNKVDSVGITEPNYYEYRLWMRFDACFRPEVRSTGKNATWVSSFASYWIL
jgi:hypothetical protein